MIEELQLLIGMVGDLAGSALYVLGGFLGWKLIVYLSTVGSCVYLVKLISGQIKGYLHARLETPTIVEHLHSIQGLLGVGVTAETKDSVVALLNSMLYSYQPYDWSTPETRLNNRLLRVVREAVQAELTVMATEKRAKEKEAEEKKLK